MRSHKDFFTLFMLFGLLALAASVPAAVNELKAMKIDKGPVIDGKPDKIWNKVRPIQIKLTEGKQGEVTASVKALYSETDLYLLIRWKDSTESLNRLYEFDGTQWKEREGDEDRLGILWNMNDSIKDFEKKGCFVLCHEEGKYMQTNAPNERGDIWHWQAQRSNPVGYADDQILTNKMHKHYHGTQLHESGRFNDKREWGGFSNNWDKATKSPKFMFKDRTQSGPILIRPESVKIPKDAVFQKGTILPREVLGKPHGSRGDIEAKGVWNKGTWTLEIKRALDTGHEDDIQFDPSKIYHFGMSIFDDSYGKGHATTKEFAYKLIFR